MIENFNSKSDEILERAIELLKEGKSKDEILDKFPEYKEKLKSLLEVVEILKEKKAKTFPSKDSLKKILSQVKIPPVTKIEKDRYIYEERGSTFKGRPSILQALKIEGLLNFMEKKIYLVGLTLLIICAIAGIYWYSQKGKKEIVLPEVNELSYGTESISQDITDLKVFEEDKNLDTLETDLSAVAEEVSLEEELPQIETFSVSEIESLEEELKSDLEGFSSDLDELNTYEGDTSLNELEGSLSNFGE
ncbi:MAG TPA: hypothetical protein ENG32_02150 [bacterium]|nr:hypothetical protein [bacterium]